MSRSAEAVAVEARAYLMEKVEAALSKQLGDSPVAKSLKSELQSDIITAFSAVFARSSAPLTGDVDDEDGPVVF